MNRRLPQPSLKMRLRLTRRPALPDRESVVRYSMETWKLIGSPASWSSICTIAALEFL